MTKKIQKGKPLTELVKGSLEYTQSWISKQFRAQFPYVEGGPNFYIVDSFADHVVVESYDAGLMPSEFFEVAYTRNGDAYMFAPREEWEIVELTYQPRTRAEAEAVNETKPSPQPSPEGRGGKRKGKRLEEAVERAVELVESEAEEKPSGPWRVKAIGVTANIINGNGRRYPAHVLEAAVSELQSHLHESAGQGRMLSLTGEADHPADKGNKRPLLSETVFNWDSVTFDGAQVLLEGNLLGTSAGKDIHAQMRGGVIPGISQRGYGLSKKVKEGSVEVEEVTSLIITGYDATAPNEQSDPNGSINYFETSQQGDIEMNELLENLKKLLAENPELFNRGMTEAQLDALNEKQLKKLDESLRNVLGIDANANIIEAVKGTAEKARKFDESQKQAEVSKAIDEATKELPFGKKLNGMFIESLKSADLKTAEAVKAFAESKRKEYSQLAAAGVLKNMGFDEKTRKVQVIGDVLETETGTPEFARVAFELTESVRKHEKRAKRTLIERAESPAAVFAEQLLERFDQVFRHQLQAEARLFEEAETTSDLNLPYSVSRAVIAEAYPNLIAANVFDFGVMEQSPINIFYETFTGETGFSVAVTDEVETAGAEDTWYDLANKNIIPGTVVVTDNPATVTYVEGTDYVIDYELGRIRPLAAGAINANDLLVDYTYHATRKGENAEIERAKTTLTFQTITAAADRLSDYITHEAIVFSRSQIGWDAVGRTMANIIRELRRDKDRRLIEKALAAALSVASNKTAAWDISDAVYLDLVKRIGEAKVKVINRFYTPSSVLMSATNSDYLSNWDGFTRAGFPNALLNAAGFVGAVKGLNVFETPEMRDTFNLVLNREIVMHRVYQPMIMKGPYPTYSNGKLVAAEQYYAEEYNASLAPIGGKASVVPTQP